MLMLIVLLHPCLSYIWLRFWNSKCNWLWGDRETDLTRPGQPQKSCLTKSFEHMEPFPESVTPLSDGWPHTWPHPCNDPRTHDPTHVMTLNTHDPTHCMTHHTWPHTSHDPLWDPSKPHWQRNEKLLSVAHPRRVKDRQNEWIGRPIESVRVCACPGRSVTSEAFQAHPVLAVGSNRSHVMKIGFFCESIHANRLPRIDYSESPRFALRIAGPSKW